MSNQRLQPGDLAISINVDLPENLGVVVEVLAVGVNDDAWNTRQGPLCRVRVAGARSLHIEHKIKGRWYRHIVRECVAPENRFRRITPPGRVDVEQSNIESEVPGPPVTQGLADSAREDETFSACNRSFKPA